MPRRLIETDWMVADKEDRWFFVEIWHSTSKWCPVGDECDTLREAISLMRSIDCAGHLCRIVAHCHASRVHIIEDRRE